MTSILIPASCIPLLGAPTPQTQTNDHDYGDDAAGEMDVSATGENAVVQAVVVLHNTLFAGVPSEVYRAGRQIETRRRSR